MVEYEPVIGMEVHAELLTESKMFCGCSAAFGGEANTRVCPVCLGLPGSLPVANAKAIEHVLRTSLALNCEISRYSIFHRKNYYYPDLPKGYQISQYGDTPIGVNGYLPINVNGREKRIAINRVHLEEDTGKLLHVDGNKSEVDYNRSGVPLMEIVTQNPPPPGLDQITSAEEAREYLLALISVLTALGVCDGKMEEGSIRCEPNISIRPVGSDKFGVKTEIKNLNSIRAVFRGVEYEIKRQIRILSEGGTITQSTRRWDDDSGKTYVMRLKEYAHDYRYFPEPDLVPMRFSEERIAELRASLPELPAEKKKRFISEYSLSEYDAGVLTSSLYLADIFEAAAKESGDAKSAANWIMGDLLKLLNASGTEPKDCPITGAGIAEMLKLIENGEISGKIAKSVFEEMFNTGKSPSQIVKEKGLTQISDESEVLPIVEQVIQENPKLVNDVLEGKDKSLNFLVGQVMRYTRGQANPQIVNDLLRKLIENKRS